MAVAQQNYHKLQCRNIWKIFGPSDVRRTLTNTFWSLPSNEAAQIARSKGLVVAAADVSFDVKHGEIFVIMGLSGSGKSTMIRCLSRLVEPSHGEVLMDGDDVLKMSDAALIQLRRHKVGMVFQNFGLLPHLTVLENVMLPLRLQGKNQAEQTSTAKASVELVGLRGRENAYPRQLSGGQQQRVGIARSLATDPEFWFLDEPFSALDPLIRREMQDEFLRLQKTLKKSIVFVTHDFQEALRIADRMMIMRDGQVVQMGTPAELMLSPVNQYVRDFSAGAPVSAVLSAGMIADEKAVEGVDYQTVPSSSKMNEFMQSLAIQKHGLRIEGSESILTAQGVVRAFAKYGNEGTATKS